MKAKSLLRTASAAALLQFAAHTFLFVNASPKHGAEERAVVDAMKSHAFDFGGSVRSYWDFYWGYGLESAFVCLVEAMLFWQLASFVDSSPRLVRQIAALFLLANLGHIVLVSNYFFRIPVIPDAVIAACLIATLLTVATTSPRVVNK